MGTLYWKGGTGSQPWSTAGNWSTGAVPVAGDLVRIWQGSSNINSGLDQSALATGIDLDIRSGFTGTIGADDGGSSTDALKVKITRLFVGGSYQSGTFVEGGLTRGRFNIQGPTKVIVQTSGAPTDSSRGAVQLIGMDNTSEVDVQGGFVDIAGKPGDTATVNKVKVSGGTLLIGEGTTVSGTAPGVFQDDGELTINGAAAAIATLKQYGGFLRTFGTQAITSMTLNGESHLGHRPGSGNASDTVIVENQGQAFIDDDPRVFNVLNALQIYRGGFVQLFDKSQLVTNAGSGQIQCIGCGPGDVTLNMGQDVTLTLT